MLNNSGVIVIVNLSEDLEIQTSTIKTLYCPSKITHIACNAECLYAIGENGIVYRYTAMYDGPKTIEGIPPIDDIQCVGTDCTVVAKTKEGEYYGWASEDIFGALIPSDQDFKPDVPVRLDIEDGLKHVQFFENAGEHAILFMCVDKNDTATVYDNEKKPLKTVYDCVYTSSGPCCVWIASSDGQVRSYGTYVSGARLPRIADGPKRMISSIGWITIVVYENNSIMMTGQSWERELYFTSEDNTLFYLQ